MKYFLFLTLTLSCYANTYAQKPIIDAAVLAQWPDSPPNVNHISNDGKYVSYSINGPMSNWNISTSYLQSFDGTYKRKFSRFQDDAFTAGNRRFIYLTKSDSLCLVDLSSKNKKQTVISNVQSFKLPEDDGGHWLAYQSKIGELVLQDLFSGRKTSYDHVLDYSFSKTGKILLVKSQVDGRNQIKLQWIETANNKQRLAWQGMEPEKMILNDQESELAFIAKVDSTRDDYAIFSYKPGDNIAKSYVSGSIQGIAKNLRIANEPLEFNYTGDQLFFKLRQKPDTTRPNPALAKVDVWNYQDQFMQFDQLNNLDQEKNRTFLAVMNEGNGNITQLETEKDRDGSLNKAGNSNYFLCLSNTNFNEDSWLKNKRPDIFLVNTRDGSRVCIVKQSLGQVPLFSTGGKYLIWLDLSQNGFQTYNIQTGITRNISKDIPFEATENEGLSPVDLYHYTRKWEVRDAAVFLQARYDIWQVDPDGISPPVNITNGNGEANHIRFSFAINSQDPDYGLLKPGKPILLCALNDQSINNGFFRIVLGTVHEPEKLIMKNSAMYLGYAPFNWGIIPPPDIVKAKDEDVFVLTEMKADSYPNLVMTKDFKTFTHLTNEHPEKNVNWITSELVNYTTFAGHPGQGILYKPENFDLSKKYPVIFYFYEHKSALLNVFYQPCFTNGQLNIPWFVSRGYLVFTPDIYYETGHIAENVYDYVGSAAKILSEKPWVDGKHMGIEGQSFGGLEVNLLITKTNMFAAAASAAGGSDLVSNELSSGFGVCAGTTFTELGQYRMGVPIWENPQAYLDNSPVFHADRVATPLLFFQNKKDIAVPWLQGVELFTALRRLGKPVWMLQYDNSGHGVYYPIDAEDYTKRLTQFFDHYLKGAPTPKWMQEGIPASKKQIDDGFELEAPGVEPKPLDIVPVQQHQ